MLCLANYNSISADSDLAKAFFFNEYFMFLLPNF